MGYHQILSQQKLTTMKFIKLKVLLIIIQLLQSYVLLITCTIYTSFNSFLQQPTQESPLNREGGQFISFHFFFCFFYVGVLIFHLIEILAHQILLLGSWKRNVISPNWHLFSPSFKQFRFSTASAELVSLVSRLYISKKRNLRVEAASAATRSCLPKTGEYVGRCC